MKNKKVSIGHGSGGKLTRKLIQEVFLPHFSNPYLEAEDDSAVIELAPGRQVFSTDAFTVTPLFYPGGDIGKLAVCGVVNDLVMTGAKPKFLSATFVMEEGLSLETLEKIAQSFGKECERAKVQLVAADTKVVQKGKADQIFISVSGIGELREELDLSADRIQEGDKVIVTGDIGDHGAAILLARGELNIQADIQSDCACLDSLIQRVIQNYPTAIKQMRDATRGGVGSIVNELASLANIEIMLWEKKLPIKPPVQGLCEMLGLNPLYLVNEGKAVLIVEQAEAENVLVKLQEHPLGKNAVIIGEVVSSKKENRVYLETVTRGKRILDSLVEDQFPRIC